MRQYGLSEQKVRGVIRNPRRRETGIAPQTIAVMQPVSPKKEIWKQEVWVMYQIRRGAIKVISAWRYPGVSPKRHPIPDEILRELEEGSILEPSEDV